MEVTAVLANNPLTIVDVGASGGIDDRWAKLTSSYRGILFEPDPREYEDLRAKSGKNLFVFNSALSGAPETIDFHLCSKQQVSSVYRPNQNFLRAFPDASRFDIEKTTRVSTDTLSNQLSSKGFREIDFIKIDTQGHELSILRGSLGHLDTVVGLELEVEFAALYEGQPLFNEVDSFVRANGFELFDLKRYYWRRKEGPKDRMEKGQLVFGDALYFRSPERVLSLNGISQAQVIRAVCVYLAYGYLDLAQTLFRGANARGLLDETMGEKVSSIISQYHSTNHFSNFRGKGRLRRFFQNLSKRFGTGSWYYGADEVLGNL